MMPSQLPTSDPQRTARAPRIQPDPEQSLAAQPPAPLLTRRRIAQGVAWAAPAVLLSAPARAIAASCQPQTLTTDWSSSAYTRTSQTQATYQTTLADGHTETISFASTFSGNLQPGDPVAGLTTNLSARQGTYGGTTQSVIQIQQTNATLTGNKWSYASGGSRTDRQEIVITFDVPVTDLQFTITDIDSGGLGTFWDKVEITGAAYTYSIASSAQVVGNGSQASPFSPPTSSQPVADSGGTANVTITMAGPVTSFTLTYWNGVALSPGQISRHGIYLTNFTATVPCP